MISSGVMSASVIVVGDLPRRVCGKAEEQHEAHRGRRHRLRAQRALLGQVLGEEGLHEGGE